MSNTNKMTKNHIHKLTGCSPIPLANYLKALGILRLVAEQADPAAQGWWSGDVFHLRTTLDEAAIFGFFLEDYQPTPIVVPWSGSDFFAAARNPVASDFKERWPEKKPPKSFPTSEKVIEAILVSETARLGAYREMIRGVFKAMDVSNTLEKKDIEGAKGKEQKRTFLTCLRGMLPDAFVSWLDAAAALGTDEFAFNTLLGSGGGSDGNSHFSDNFMQSVWICLPDFDGQRRTEVRASDSSFSSVIAIRAALFSTQSSQAVIRGRSPGLFSSQDVGGPNATAGFEADASFNPWNYVLLLEGCLAFSGALSKRIGSGASSEASFPFLMRLSNAGTGTLIAGETSGRELWLPLWDNPSDYRELSVFFAEGRLSLGSEYVRNGLDAARAVASFGFDRGIKSFERVGIVRGRVGGDNYNTAVSLGCWTPQRNEQIDRITEIDAWLNSFRRAVSSDNAPSRAKRALRRLESAILELCQQKGPARLQAVLVALGEAEAALVLSSELRAEAFQRPVPLLSPKWLADCDDGTSEFRLAISLAAMSSSAVGDFRQHIEPVEVKGRLAEGRSRWVEWTEDSSAACNIVWNAGDLENNLIAVLKRRVVEAVRHGERSDDGTLVFSGQSLCSASLGDVGAFLRHETDDARIATLVRGFVLLDWGRVQQSLTHKELQRGRTDPMPDATFSLLKLCHTPWTVRDVSVRLEPTIARLAAAGHADAAIKYAARRLIGSGLSPAIRVASRDTASTHRMAAALLFPLSWADVNTLANSVLKPQLTSIESVGNL